MWGYKNKLKIIQLKFGIVIYYTYICINKNIKTMTNEQAKKVISLINEKIRLSQNEELGLFLQLVNNTYYDYEVNVGYYKGVVEKLIYSTIIKRENKLVG